MKDGKWMRVEATAAEDDDREARVSMLEAYPNLKALYFFLMIRPPARSTLIPSTTLYSFTEPPVVYHC